MISDKSRRQEVFLSLIYFINQRHKAMKVTPNRVDYSGGLYRKNVNSPCIDLLPVISLLTHFAGQPD